MYPFNELILNLDSDSRVNLHLYTHSHDGDGPMLTNLRKIKCEMHDISKSIYLLQMNRTK